MSFSMSVGRELPFLRRYARALTGSQRSGDAYVQALLEAALEDDKLREQLVQGRVALYRAFNQLWKSTHAGDADTNDMPASLHELATRDRLSRITPLARQALLLSALEDMGENDIAKVLDVDVSSVATLIEDAINDVSNDMATSVLIIEDEPLIAMQLEDVVLGLGHHVAGTATTHVQAVAAARNERPGLVLADIQLADGSSGLDAVADILDDIDVPVIFITAYPEKLLTGSRTEPTYLVTKPFREATVRAAISQALFFQSSVPVAQ